MQEIRIESKDKLGLSNGLFRLGGLFDHDDKGYLTDEEFIILLNNGFASTTQGSNPENTVELLNKRWKLIPFESFWMIGEKKTSTAEHTPNSPYIKYNKELFGERILTVTYLSHNLGYGPQYDLLIPLDKTRIFALNKQRDEKTAKDLKIIQITKWSDITELLTVKPDNIYDKVVIISLWNKSNVNDRFYTLFLNIDIKGITLGHLIAYLHGKANLPLAKK